MIDDRGKIAHFRESDNAIQSVRTHLHNVAALTKKYSKKLQLDLAITEFCHLLRGHWVLTSESGQVTEIKAGDSWVFPNGWKGTAEVLETVRKVYMVVGPT